MTHKCCSSRRHEKRTTVDPAVCRGWLATPQVIRRLTCPTKSLPAPPPLFEKLGRGRGEERGELTLSSLFRGFSSLLGSSLRNSKMVSKCCIHFPTQFIIINQNGAVNRQLGIKHSTVRAANHYALVAVCYPQVHCITPLRSG